MSKPRLSHKPRISPISTKKSHSWNQNIVIAYPTVTKYSKTLRTNRCIQWKRLWHFRYSISKSSSQRDWRNWSTSNTFPLVFWLTIYLTQTWWNAVACYQCLLSMCLHVLPFDYLSHKAYLWETVTSKHLIDGWTLNKCILDYLSLQIVLFWCLLLFERSTKTLLLLFDWELVLQKSATPWLQD